MKANPKNACQRLISLDIFRGVTIALMILVNSPGNKTPYSWLDHSAWNGCTLADLVFPFFIMIVGISSVLALTNLRLKNSSMSTMLKKICRRSAYIFLIGLLLNAFPHHVDLSTLRILGVLQRIAICYLCSALLFFTTKIQTQAMIMLVLLLGYGCLMVYTPLTLDNNLAGYLDQLILTPGHLYTSTFEPEGLLSTLPAIATVLLGNLIGYLLTTQQTKKQHLQWMLISSLVLIFLGWIWSFALPINKALWSSPYVVWTAGLALLVFSAIYFLIEIKHWVRWSTPFDLLGRHALLVYILHVLFLKIQACITIHSAEGTVINLRLYLTAVLFDYFTPENAALCYAVSYTMLWLLVIKCYDKWKLQR